MLKIGTPPPEDFEGGGREKQGQHLMKKWIVFLSVASALLLTVIIFQSQYLWNLISTINRIKATSANKEIPKEVIDSIIEQNLSTIIKTCIGIFFLLLLLASCIFLLVAIAKRKITLISVSESFAEWKTRHIAAWKEHCAQKKAERKQRKLEKAQNKVEQLQEELKKDE